MEIRIAICDDTINELAIMKKFLEQFIIKNDIKISMDAFNSGNELLTAYKNKPYDIIFLDIEMPNSNGLYIAKQIRSYDKDKTYIIFTTSYPKYMHDSFEVQPFQFLIKPISYEMIEKQLISILDKMTNSHDQKIVIDVIGEKHFIDLNNLLYISTTKGKKLCLTFHLLDGEIESHGKISEYETSLFPYGFFSTSRGFIVNLNNIASFNSERIILKTGISIPISRRKLTDFQKYYANHIIKFID